MSYNLDMFNEVRFVAGTTAHGANFTAGTLDMVGVDGNVLLAIHAFSGTGTLGITVSESSDGTTYSTIGTETLFNPDTGAADTFDNVDDGTNAGQYLAIRSNRARRYITATFATTDSDHEVSVTAIVPRKYANFEQA